MEVGREEGRPTGERDMPGKTLAPSPHGDLPMPSRHFVCLHRTLLIHLSPSIHTVTLFPSSYSSRSSSSVSFFLFPPPLLLLFSVPSSHLPNIHTRFPLGLVSASSPRPNIPLSSFFRQSRHCHFLTHHTRPPHIILPHSLLTALELSSRSIPRRSSLGKGERITAFPSKRSPPPPPPPNTPRLSS
ncbi:hypothetical protein IE53DRAFT_81807 [Violaceomyces palustris]|uniref:Uncharacterized protein n=1 Tax=Violaceomyces palustris TaxID=1673888 RepID=A0ACD0NY36_9BASI|nr:hypothetical protein IE53DRAFT_81807 [Violaceomyces palustris]